MDMQNKSSLRHLWYAGPFTSQDNEQKLCVKKTQLGGFKTRSFSKWLEEHETR